MIWMHSSVAPRLEVALLLTAAFLRAGPSRPRAWIGALYAAGAIARLLWGAAGSASWPWRLHGLVGILALSCPFFVWALARSIFEDDFCAPPTGSSWPSSSLPGWPSQRSRVFLTRGS